MSPDRNISITNPDILEKLAEVLDLIFKKRKRGAAYQDSYYANTFLLKKAVLPGKNSDIINECLLNHRFNEAAKLLSIMCQDRCSFDLVLYKGIMVTLENLISSDELETIKTVTRDMRQLRSINKLELQLEYLIYALKNDVNGAEDLYYLEDKNEKRKKTVKVIPCIEQLYSAYTTLISYITWANIPQSEKSSQASKELALKIIHSFKQLVSNPGIWDIFVVKLIEMLEYYEQYDELQEILQKYVELNPNHVNAYIYLCVHLHKHDADPKMFIQYSKILSKLCPSDERLLLLVQKWDQLGKNLKILFKFLDYPINGHQLLGWQLLFINLCKATSSNESCLLELIDSSWKKRCSSWTYMHFKLSNISTDPFQLIQWKMKILCIVQPDHEYINKAKEKLEGCEEYLLENRDSSATFEDFRSLYSINNFY